VKLREISPFKVNSQNLFTNEYNEDETKLIGPMERWIPSLYKCLMNHPGFNRKKQWNEMPTLPVLAEFLVSEVARLADGFGWVIRRNLSDTDGVCIEYFRHTNYDGAWTLSLEWLLRIEKQNPKLGFMAIVMTAKVARAWGLDVVHTEYNDLVIQDPAAHVHNGFDDVSDARLFRDLKAYEDNGAAVKMKARMESLARRTSNETLFRQLAKFRPKNACEKGILEWLKKGIVVLQDPGNIGGYVFEPLDYDSDENGAPLTARDIFSIHWSFHDAIYEITESYMNDTAQNCGIVPATVSSCYSEYRGNPLEFTKEKIDKLATFIRLGRWVYFKWYNEFFQKMNENPEYDKTLMHILSR
jgi:hypothetical protein